MRVQKRKSSTSLLLLLLGLLLLLVLLVVMMLVLLVLLVLLLGFCPAEALIGGVRAATVAFCKRLSCDGFKAFGCGLLSDCNSKNKVCVCVQGEVPLLNPDGSRLVGSGLGGKLGLDPQGREGQRLACMTDFVTLNSTLSSPDVETSLFYRAITGLVSLN